jgi:hypothetical protein
MTKHFIKQSMKLRCLPQPAFCIKNNIRSKHLGNDAHPTYTDTPTQSTSTDAEQAVNAELHYKNSCTA